MISSPIASAVRSEVHSGVGAPRDLGDPSFATYPLTTDFYGIGSVTTPAAASTRHQRNASGDWEAVASGTMRTGHYSPAGVYLGTLMEGERENYFTAPSVPITRTIDLTAAGTGDYTLAVFGSGTVTSADNGSTGTGHGAATDGSPVTFNLSVAGTVDFTVSGGTPDFVNVEKAAFISSPNITVSPATQASDFGLLYPAANLPVNNFSGRLTFTPSHDSGDVGFAGLYGAEVDGDNKLLIMYDGGNSKYILRQRIGGVSKDAEKTAETYSAGDTKHISWRKGPEGLDLWVEGNKGTTNAETGDLSAGGLPEIGSLNGGTTNPAEGAIKDVKLYEALSDADLAALSS